MEVKSLILAPLTFSSSEQGLTMLQESFLWISYVFVNVFVFVFIYVFTMHLKMYLCMYLFIAPQHQGFDT